MSSSSNNILDNNYVVVPLPGQLSSQLSVEKSALLNGWIKENTLSESVLKRARQIALSLSKTRLESFLSGLSETTPANTLKRALLNFEIKVSEETKFASVIDQEDVRGKISTILINPFFLGILDQKSFEQCIAHEILHAVQKHDNLKNLYFELSSGNRDFFTNEEADQVRSEMYQLETRIDRKVNAVVGLSKIPIPIPGDVIAPNGRAATAMHFFYDHIAPNGRDSLAIPLLHGQT